MKRHIFYSWQSDLPNNTNRNVIEEAVQKAIQKTNHDLLLDLSFDKDTNDVIGTPEIVDTIFKKIETASVFIADITIINTKESSRKMPNPNVLIELGYALKAIGWERIICIYNTDYGKIEDLPFDLRQRRPLAYSLSNKIKSKVIEDLSGIISWNINQLAQRGLLYDELQDYLKEQIDTQILRLLGHLSKILFGYEEYITLESAYKLLKLSQDEITILLENRAFLGFQVLKKFDQIESDIRNILDKTLSSSHYKRELMVPIVKIIKWITFFDKYNSFRTTPNLFISTCKTNKIYESIHGKIMNPDNPKNGYLLLEKIDKQYGRIIDFGDFIEKEKIKKMLYTLKMNPIHGLQYANQIYLIIEYIHEWLDLTNGEFIVDTSKEYEMKYSQNFQGKAH